MIERLINYGSTGDREGYVIDGDCTYHAKTFLRDFQADVRTLKLITLTMAEAIADYEQAITAAGSLVENGVEELEGDADIVKRIVKARERVESAAHWLQSSI